MIDALTITLSGPPASGKSIIGGIIAKVLHERGADVEVLLDGCPAPDSGIDLSGFAVVVREGVPRDVIDVTGPPVSEMLAEIRSRIIAMGIEPRRVGGVYVHPSSGLLKVRHRPPYMREAVLSEETAEEYAAWQARKRKAKPEATATCELAGITVTIAGPAGAGKTRFGEYLLRALSDYGSTLGKTQDVVEQNIRRFRESEEAGRPVYVGQFEGSPLLLGTRTVEPDAIA